MLLSVFSNANATRKAFSRDRKLESLEIDNLEMLNDKLQLHDWRLPIEQPHES